MRFSKKSEYALRALTELTEHYGHDLLQRQQIAERQHIPIEFLEQILLALKNAGLLATQILSTADASLTVKMQAYKDELRRKVEESAESM